MPFRTPDEMAADEAELKRLVDAVTKILDSRSSDFPMSLEDRVMLASAVLPFQRQPVVGTEVKVRGDVTVCAGCGREIAACRAEPCPEIAPPPKGKFVFQFSREVTVYDGFTRTIEAYTVAQAQQIANEMAVDFDSDVPDDCIELEHMGSDFGQFDANLAPPVDQPKEG